MPVASSRVTYHNVLQAGAGDRRKEGDEPAPVTTRPPQDRLLSELRAASFNVGLAARCTRQNTRAAKNATDWARKEPSGQGIEDSKSASTRQPGARVYSVSKLQTVWSCQVEGPLRRSLERAAALMHHKEIASFSRLRLELAPAPRSMVEPTSSNTLPASH
ncbi:hypothetical protein GQ53DRAFT_388962 [Thozetella sp. PMI_491]|nr:hypothetical protein GQ53DRAFT_388962 [Thozetella sp. PMI_491]